MTSIDELRKKLEWFRADLCNAGCAVECATWEKRKALIDGVIDEYAQAIAAMLVREECEPTEEYACNICGQDLVACDIGIGPNGGAIELDPPTLFNFCPKCGAKVVE